MGRIIFVPIGIVGGLIAGQISIFRLAKGLVDRGARKGYMRLTGSWPGEEEPEST